MTATETRPVSTPSVPPASAAIYRDIHKGIRAELFDVTLTAGRVDPSDAAAKSALAAHVATLVELLVSHAAHEDAAVQPEIEIHLPDVAATIVADHARLEARMDDLCVLANESVDSVGSARRDVAQFLYLELASFTSEYLAHQNVEEQVVMPGLERAIGSEALAVIHGTIVASIPPQQAASSLAIMLPAMNVEDRAELLGGMRAGAPADVFAGVWGLTGAVLTPADYEQLAVRLGI
jgi:hemerythrin HHE cation binding domain-containing protein